MAFVSDGSYGVPEGLVYGFPVTVKNGQVEIVKGLEINAFSRARHGCHGQEELDEEREAVKQWPHLDLIWKLLAMQEVRLLHFF